MIETRPAITDDDPGSLEFQPRSHQINHTQAEAVVGHLTLLMAPNGSTYALFVQAPVAAK